jgi:hypothetical protein
MIHLTREQREALIMKSLHKWFNHHTELMMKGKESTDGKARINEFKARLAELEPEGDL